MHIEFLVEEESAKVVLEALIPHILPNVSFRVHPFRGKQDLLNQLEARLRGYAAWIRGAPGYRMALVVLVDNDQEDCYALKRKLEEAAQRCGLATKSHPDARGCFVVVNRIAIEELEAWFFGDVSALRQAYPRIPSTLAQRRRYRNPDAIRGGTWEALDRLLRRYRYRVGGKLEVARKVAPHLDPSRNRSRSFQAFRAGLTSLLQQQDC